MIDFGNDIPSAIAQAAHQGTSFVPERRAQQERDDYAATLQVDTTTPYGKLFFTIVAAFAEFYREDIALRTSKAMLRHQANGRRMTRTDCCPYGKMPDWNGPMLETEDEDGKKVLRPAQMIDCPEEQAIIARIRQGRQQGKGLREIARSLDAEGVACRGRRWHHATVGAILARAGNIAEAS